MSRRQRDYCGTRLSVRSYHRQATNASERCAGIWPSRQPYLLVGTMIWNETRLLDDGPTDVVSFPDARTFIPGRFSFTGAFDVR